MLQVLLAIDKKFSSASCSFNLWRIVVVQRATTAATTRKLFMLLLGHDGDDDVDDDDDMAIVAAVTTAGVFSHLDIHRLGASSMKLKPPAEESWDCVGGWMGGLKREGLWIIQASRREVCGTIFRHIWANTQHVWPIKGISYPFKYQSHLCVYITPILIRPTSLELKRPIYPKILLFLVENFLHFPIWLEFPSPLYIISVCMSDDAWVHFITFLLSLPRPSVPPLNFITSLLLCHYGLKISMLDKVCFNNKPKLTELKRDEVGEAGLRKLSRAGGKERGMTTTRPPKPEKTTQSGTSRTAAAITTALRL